MAYAYGWGADMSKWLIKRSPVTGRWYICPPRRLLDTPGAGGGYATGEEALEAFAAAGSA